jgi:hypothetical protein
VRAALALTAALASACASTRGPTDWPSATGELARRVERDQDARRALMAGGAIDLAAAHELEAIDAENTAWMKELVARHGWPTLAEVGPKASGEAWLLVQHADRDVEFQEHCLALLEAAAPRGEAEKKHLAYLHDRVAMHRGRPQRYGTQFTQRDGQLEPYTLEDPARVDEWRAEMGLGTLAEYRKLFEER